MADTVELMAEYIELSDSLSAYLKGLLGYSDRVPRPLHEQDIREAYERLDADQVGHAAEELDGRDRTLLREVEQARRALARSMMKDAKEYA